MKLTAIGALLTIAISFIPGCRDRPQQRRAGVASDQQFAATTESAETVLALPQFDVCSMESVRSVSDNSLNPGDVPNSWKVEKGQAYDISGFVVDKAQGSVPQRIRLLLVGKNVHAVTTRTGVERPDVAQYFSWGGFLRAGYSSEVAFDDVPAGDYQILVAETQDSRTFVCRTFQTISIR